MIISLEMFWYPTLLLFFPCILAWNWALKERNQWIQTIKVSVVFLIWFIPNWVLIMNYFLSPTIYEPSPFLAGPYALQITLPLFLILTIPFLVLLIRQLKWSNKNQ